jgi:hypothetical protein
MVCENVCKSVPYTVCKPVHYCKTVKVCKKVCVEVPYTYTRCVPRTVCEEVQVPVCCPAPSRGGFLSRLLGGRGNSCGC